MRHPARQPVEHRRGVATGRRQRAPGDVPLLERAVTLRSRGFDARPAGSDRVGAVKGALECQQQRDRVASLRHNAGDEPTGYSTQIFLPVMRR